MKSATGRNLNVGVVGLKIGAGHVADYIASPSVENVAICELDERKLNEIGDKFGIRKRYMDFADMLAKEKLDAVSVALPNKLHCPVTLQALAAGCHVLCEKPMGRNARDAADMLAAAHTYNRKLMINFNQRFDPLAQTVRQLILDGKLGEIYFARTTWHRRRGVPRWYRLTKAVNGGGALIDLGVHMLDKTMWLCGYPEPEWVLGNTFNKIETQSFPDFELEDMGVAMIRMTNGAMLELEASWAGNREGESITTRLYGTKGGLLMSSTDKNRLFLEYEGKLANVELVEGQYDNAPLGPRTNVRQAFLDAILNDTAVSCTPEQGLTINRMLDAIYESAASGVPVRMANAAHS